MVAMILPSLNSCEHTLNTLRYAERVKELVKDAPNVLREQVLEQIIEEGDTVVKNKNGQMSENDLAHAAISDLQQSEEMVVDQHRALIDFMTQFLPESNRLYNLANNVDCD